MFAFIDKVNHDSPPITPNDAERVREAGWTDDELYFAITVCALLNFYNRWIDATGVHAMSDDAHRAGAKRSAQHGYVRAIGLGSNTPLRLTGSMKQPIVGYHQDDEGHWVADLACGHGQHVRHDPPWQVREWVTTPEGRATRLGMELECVRCDESPSSSSTSWPSQAM